MKLNGNLMITSEKLKEIIQKYMIENSKGSGQTPAVVSLDPVIVEEEVYFQGHYGPVSEFQGIKVLFEVESDIVDC